MMKLSIHLPKTEHCIDTSKYYDISIPVLFNGPQPNIYNTTRATTKAYKGEGYVGDTRQGGSCNFETHIISPHLNGTHTECVGHITHERIAINEILKDLLTPATLLTVKPMPADETTDTYRPTKNEEDFLITKDSLCIEQSDFLACLIIRTLPNDSTKKSRQYMNVIPPFLSLEAIEYINQIGVKHLVLDIPSLDRTFDEGRLTAHHLFWGVEEESHEVAGQPSTKTITEMAYIADEITDGHYFLNIQIPNFVTDAAPSRLTLYPLI